MKIFVTGITGHSGRFYTQRLAAEGSGDQFVCLVRETSNTDLLDSSGIDFTKAVGDLSDVDFMAEHMAGCDMVLHIAGIYQSINVINAALRAGVQNAIVVHTTGMYSRFKSASADYIKVEEEVLSHRDKINITVLRPTMIYGTSGDRNMYKLINYLDRHSFFPVFGSGKNLMQPVHAKDLGDAYYDVIRNWERLRQPRLQPRRARPDTVHRDHTLCGTASGYKYKKRKVSHMDVSARRVRVQFPI